jgi:hypothetical protein
LNNLERLDSTHTVDKIKKKIQVKGNHLVLY